MDDHENTLHLDLQQIININEEEKTIYFHQNLNENDIVELKVERKEVKLTQLNRRYSETKIDDFMKPLVDDYMNCEHRDITNCHAIKRILHLLVYYDKLQKKDNEMPVSIHEYLLKFTNYTVSLVMEDWYHCKKMHLMDKDVDIFINGTGINCIHDKACKYLRRYQRDRSRDTFNDSQEE
eukprot:139829_1